MLAGTSLTEEGVETVVTPTEGLVGGHLPIWLDAMLQTVQLPARVPYLDARLADVHRDAFPL
jgi:hypothetical protein